MIYDKKIEGYNQKIESLNTQHSEKLKENDDKISKLKLLLVIIGKCLETDS